MTRRLRRFASAIGLGLAVVLVGTGVAGATTTILTDEIGDATLCNRAHIYPVDCPNVDSDPAIDIVDADLGTSPGGDLVAKVHVLDLDDPFSSYRKDTWYSFSTWVEQGTIIQLDAERHGDAIVGKMRVAGPDGGSTVLTPVSFNFSTNRVRWDVPMSVLNERLDIACASCADVGPGTVLTYASVYTRASQLSVYSGLTGSETSGELVNKVDDASGSFTYTVGT